MSYSIKSTSVQFTNSFDASQLTQMFSTGFNDIKKKYPSILISKVKHIDSEYIMHMHGSLEEACEYLKDCGYDTNSEYVMYMQGSLKDAYEYLKECGYDKVILNNDILEK